MSECPVCKNEYIEGSQKTCQNCGWDLTVDGSLAQLPEQYRQHQAAQLEWARQIWRFLIMGKTAQDELEWKVAEIQGKLVQVWGRFEQGNKERSQLQHQIGQILGGLEMAQRERADLATHLASELCQIKTELAEIYSALHQFHHDQRQCQERIEALGSNLDKSLAGQSIPENGSYTLPENRATVDMPTVQLSDLKGKLEEYQQERLKLQEQLERERRQRQFLQAQIQHLKENLSAVQQQIAAEASANGINLLINALASPSESMQRVAYALLQQSESPKAKQAIEAYKPYRLFSCLRVLHHGEAVRSIAISPNGNAIASGGNDKTVKIWDLKTGSLLRTLVGHHDSVISVSISPDGQLLASGSGDNTIKVWRWEAGELVCTLKGHTAWVTTVAFSGDGKMLASGSADKLVKIWDPLGEKLLCNFFGHANAVRSVAISPQGNILASGSNDNTVKIRNIRTGELLHSLIEHSGSVCSVAISPDGNTLVSGSNDTTVKIWNLGTGKLLHSLSEHASAVTSVAVGNGKTVASGSDDGTIKIWNLEMGRSIHTIEGVTMPESGHQGYVLCTAIEPQGMAIASGYDDGTVKIWGVDNVVK